jgi:predicted NBD/HSP70 family sugar kinase
VTQLLEEDLVAEVEDGEGRLRATPNGRPRKLLTLNPAGGVALGIDFSYRQVRVAVADLAHTVLVDRVADLAPDQGWAANLDLAAELSHAALASVGMSDAKLLGAGLGVPGPVDQSSGTVGFSSNAAAWVGVHASDELAKRLGVPVTADT